jgi:putative transposase
MYNSCFRTLRPAEPWSESHESQASFCCRQCGFRLHADVNAAINIERRWNTPLLSVEADGCAAREVETPEMAA